MNQSDSKKTTVINVRSGGGHRVYVPGGRGVYIGRGGKWGNPFKIGVDGDRDEVCEKYRKWIKEPDRKPLYDRIIKELKGKVLVCYCAPKRCHGDILAAITNGEEK